MKKRIDDLIDEALKTELSFKLRGDFKDRVIQAIQKKEKASQRRLYLWMALGIVMIIGMGVGTIAYFMPSVFEALGSGNTNGTDQVVPLGVLAGVLVLVIQFLDKKLVKDRMLQA